METLLFTLAVETPTLRPGDMVICDNLRVHKVTNVKDLVGEAIGATMKALRPYSSDLNPIE
jgi:transposase